MLRGRNSGDNDEKNGNSPPDRLIHFEPEEGSSESNEENGSVFGTYYKHIAADDSENDGDKLFGKKPADNFGNPNTDTEEPSSSVVEESSAVTFQPDDISDADLSESSFPIFLSFKANDPAKSVSEALREKSNTGNGSTDETIDLVQDNTSDSESEDVLSDDYIVSSDDPFDIPLDELAVPIFKPIEVKPVDKNTTAYEIPKVFENKSDSIEPSEDMISDSNDSGHLFFPLSDVPEEPNLEFESDPYEGTVLSDTSEEPESAFNASRSEKLSEKISGFSFIPDISDTPSTPDSDTSSVIQNDSQSLDDSLPIAEETPVSEAVSENLYGVSNEAAPIFASDSTPSKFITEDIFDPTSNATGELFDKEGVSPDSKTEIAAIDSVDTEDISSVPLIKTRGNSSRARNESVAAVLKDDGFAVFKEVNSTDNESAKSIVDSNNVLTERPGRNYSSKQVSSTVSPAQKGIQSSTNLDRSGSKYTAAQQMGTVAPLPQRYHKKSRRSAAPYVPIIVLIIVIVLFIGLWQAWLYFDLGNVLSNLFGSKSEPQVSTFQTPSSSSIISSDTASTSSETTATPTSTPTPTPSPTPTTEPTETSAETTAATTATTTIIPGEPTKFATKILNGSSDGATAYFDLRFENSGSYDSSLVDSLKQITITYESSQTIEEVTSSYFTFVKKEGSTNVFIGTPTSTAIILQDEFVLVDITGVTAGAKVGSFTIKYFIEYNS